MKRKLINSFIILSASSTISKIFSILNRMLLSRLLPLEAMSLYLVIMPTLSLCLTLGQVGIPSAVFRLILHPKYKTSDKDSGGRIYGRGNCCNGKKYKKE